MGLAGPRVVVLERSDSFAGIWSDLSASAGAAVDLVSEVAELGSMLPSASVCAAVISCAGTESASLEWAGRLRSLGVERVALVGAQPDHRLAIGAVRSGASDYFVLPDDLEVLRGWLTEGVESWRSAERASELALEERRAFDFSRLIGRSPGLQAALDRAGRIIPRPSTTVLLTGETGTGKELLAHAIHYNGPRASCPFIEVNCAALPPTLLEAELFGYESGAFTDARSAKPGLFEAADGGTLFLDEIGDMQLDLQVKLLKVLEDRRTRRLGSVRAVEVDVRIIAATSVDLPVAVREGRFREDLYYRLSVVPIELPALRDRGDDVLLLAQHFLVAFGAAYDVTGLSISDAVRRAIAAWNWPGNVRELRNAIERAVLLGDGQVRVEDLFLDLSRSRGETGSGVLPFPASLDEIERSAARAMVERHGGNKSLAAASLEISRSRLYRLLAEDEVS